jgi:hypothetical protein
MIQYSNCNSSNNYEYQAQKKQEGPQDQQPQQVYCDDLIIFYNIQYHKLHVESYTNKNGGRGAPSSLDATIEIVRVEVDVDIY